MTRRQLARFTRDVLAWQAPPGIGLQLTIVPLHGAATVHLVSTSGPQQAASFRSVGRRRELHRLLDLFAADMTPCTCPICRSQAAVAQSPTPYLNRPRIDPTGFAGVN